MAFSASRSDFDGVTTSASMEETLGFGQAKRKFIAVGTMLRSAATIWAAVVS